MYLAQNLELKNATLERCQDFQTAAS
jgi:hypothetical protein